MAAPVREVELKGVVDDETACRVRLESNGARLVEEGRLVDRRYDLPGWPLRERDEVVRVRAFAPRDGGAERTTLDWKGPTQHEGGYKVRDELATAVESAAALDVILRRIGLVVTREIDRDVAVYAVAGATVRLERYPRMDVLVEVEGEPDAIERAIDATGLPRGGFGTARLADYAAAFERRTGQRAALCDRELGDDAPYDPADA